MAGHIPSGGPFLLGVGGAQLEGARQHWRLQGVTDQSVFG